MHEMNIKPFISIIIVTYNNEKDILQCIDLIFHQVYPLNRIEIIVVDNNSNDNTIQLLREFSINNQKITIMENKTNLGWAIGNNNGFSISRGEYLVFLNPDTIVDKFWLNEMINIYFNRDNVGIVSSKILFYQNHEIINSIGTYIGPFGIPGSLGKGQRYDLFNKIKSIMGPSGTSLMIRRNIFIKSGRFNEDFFLYCDDLDIGCRIWNMGYSVIYSPKSIVFHKEHASNINSEKYYYLMTKNGIKLTLQYFPFRKLLLRIPISIISNIIEFIIFYLNGKMRISKAIILGIIDLLFRDKKIKNNILFRNDKVSKLSPSFYEDINLLKEKYYHHIK